jgi:hypothetical protein
MIFSNPSMLRHQSAFAGSTECLLVGSPAAVSGRSAKMIWSGSRDFDARASNDDIFDIDRTDPLAARSEAMHLSILPSRAIILNASASVTPMQRNDRCEQPLSKY